MSFLLFEAASGYGLFEVTAADELAQGVDAVQQAVANIERFGKSEQCVEACLACRTALAEGMPRLHYNCPQLLQLGVHARRAGAPRCAPSARAMPAPAAPPVARRREADCLQALHLGRQRPGADQCGV